jgi:hypothetical protein
MAQNTTVQAVPEEEVVTTSTDDSSASVTQVNQGEVLINMEAMIRQHLTAIDSMQDEVKKHKDLLDDIFAQDPVYQEHDKLAKEAAKVRTTTKAQILQRPQAAELNAKIKEMKNEQKNLQDALSDYRQEYARRSGVNEIEDDAGEVREIVYEAKLIKKAFRV